MPSVDDDLARLGPTLERLANERGLSGAAIAEASGGVISQTTFSAWVRGVHQPGVIALAIVARILRTTVSEILREAGIEREPSKEDPGTIVFDETRHRQIIDTTDETTLRSLVRPYLDPFALGYEVPDLASAVDNESWNDLVAESNGHVLEVASSLARDLNRIRAEIAACRKPRKPER